MPCSLPFTPNPASEKVVVKTGERATVSLRDITGKIIRTKKSTGKTAFDVSLLNKGIYLIQADSDQKSQIKKLVIH
ncbi:MAG: T9SS type A sorting domain-containing protein [Bacteroidales bacterium]|nr:T9SS type A sorting domain-containing protein [Bacteroidales bacterium]